MVKKSIYISPVASEVTGPVARPVSRKRMGRVRLNWFVVGAVAGIGISFFLNLVVTTLVMPEVRRVTAAHKNGIETASAKPVRNVAPAENLVVETDKTPAPAAVVATKTDPAISYPRTLALKLAKGKTLVDMLIANKVDANDAKKVMAALGTNVKPEQLQPGQKISVTLARHETIGDAAAVKELAIKLPNFSVVELERQDNGAFNVQATKDAMAEAKSYHGVGVVRSSLYQAGAEAGIPANTMREVVKAFSYDVDFQRDVHPGDKIEVLMAKPAANAAANTAKPLRYAALTLRGKKTEIFAFKDSNGELAWFDAKGNSIKKSLLRTPMDAAYITSGFGVRTHPILGYTKMHKGVDFGAPSGTPIMAAGDGTVETRGWSNGYGNFVLIRHNGTYETAYGHMSRFGNISVGSHVKQGQIIGYVGMTGMATGPHLHYEVRQNEVQVNPTAKQFNLAAGLTGKAMSSFMSNRASIMGELASLNGTPLKVASVEPVKAKTKAAAKPARKGKAAKSSRVASASKSYKVASR